MFKTLKKLVKGATVVTAVATATYVSASKKAFEEIFAPKIKKPFSEVGWLDDETRDIIRKQNEEDFAWYEKQKKQEFMLKSYDGVNLACEIIFATKHQRFVIMSHPYNSDRYQMIRACREFAEKGFNIVWYDQRACGKSGSDYNSMGWFEHLDLLKITDLIASKYKESKIILYGISMGGACVYKAMAAGLPANVKIAVIEAGFTSMKDVLNKQLKKRLSFDASSILKGVNLIAESKLGFNINNFDCLEDLNNSNCAMMLIHSKDDSMVEYNDSLTAYISYNGPKKLLAYEEGKHGALSYQDTYFKNIFEFVDKYL